MSFRDAIGLLNVSVIRMPQLRLPKAPLREAAEEAESRFTREQAPALAVADLRVLHARFLRAAESDTGWNEISNRDWRIVGHVIWEPVPALIEQPAFLVQWEVQLTAARSGRSARPWKRLIHSYLRDFDSGRPELHRVADWIIEILETERFPALDFWRRNHRLFHLFSPVDGPRHVGEAVLRSSSISIERALEEGGLDSSLRDAGFAAAAWCAACAWLQRELHATRGDTPALARMMEWSVNGARLRFEDKRVMLAHALLQPWQSGDPAAEVREILLAYLLKHYRDPRIVLGSWLGVEEWARRIVSRWLAGETLEQFFAVLDQFSNDAQWRYRKPFWLAYYRRGLIEDAWVAFGTRPLIEAKQAFRREGRNPLELPAGSVNGEQDRSALILRIAGLTVVEWSHNGKCRIWLPNNTIAPALFRRHYDRDDLNQGDEFIVDRYQGTGIAHHGSTRYTWQLQVAGFIHRHTGITITQSEYAVR